MWVCECVGVGVCEHRNGAPHAPRLAPNTQDPTPTTRSVPVFLPSGELLKEEPVNDDLVDDHSEHGDPNGDET